MMKIIGMILFFNKSFMKDYTTTFGSTIYFPSREFVEKDLNMAKIILLHELNHVYDSKKINKLLFSFLYASPQILFLFCIPLFFFSWKIALILSVICLLPIPSYFRMKFEKRAYLCSLYSSNYLYKSLNMSDKEIQDLLDSDKEFYCSQFLNSSYYFMWPFNSLKSDFDKGANRIKAGMRPYDDSFFDIIDDLLLKL